jgi:membrane associated rhomboid family serine protease
MIGSMFVHVGPAHLATNIVLIGFTMTYIAKRTNQLYSTLVAFGSHLFGAGGVMILGEVFKLGNVGGASIAGYGLLGVAALLFAKEQQYSYPWTLSFPAVIGVAELTRITLTIPTLTYAGRVTPTSHVAHTAGIVAGVVLFFTIYTPDN